MHLNARLDTLAPSGIRRYAAMAREVPGCVSLTLGEPGEDTPAPIREAAREELAAGNTHYPPNAGTPALRAAIAEHERGWGMDAEPDDMLLTIGATEALASTFAALLNPGDEVIVPTPAFSLYASQVALLQGVPVALPAEKTNFQLRADMLAAAVTPRTRAIVLNSPNNPTGCVLDAESLDAVAALAERRDLVVVCDDVYADLVFDEGFERFACRHPELADRTVVVGSFSKPWAMTGWRMGWAAAHGELAAAIAKAHQFLVSCSPAFVQRAGEVALAVDAAPLRDAWHARRDRVVAACAEMGLPLVRPAGAFYAFPQVNDLGSASGLNAASNPAVPHGPVGLNLPSDVFCERAIREAGVALVPGTCFGTEGYVRISYAAADDVLDEGLARLARFVSKLREEA